MNTYDGDINETIELQGHQYYSRPANVGKSQYLSLSVNATIEPAPGLRSIGLAWPNMSALKQICTIISSIPAALTSLPILTVSSGWARDGPLNSGPIPERFHHYAVCVGRFLDSEWRYPEKDTQRKRLCETVHSGYIFYPPQLWQDQ